MSKPDQSLFELFACRCPGLTTTFSTPATAPLPAGTVVINEEFYADKSGFFLNEVCESVLAPGRRPLPCRRCRVVGKHSAAQRGSPPCR